MKYLKIFAYVGISLAVSLFVIKWVLNTLAAPQPIDYDNLPYEFIVLGTTPDNEHLLLTIHDLSQGIQFSNEREIKKSKENRKVYWPDMNVIWLDEMDQYKYYIDYNDLKLIVKKLNDKLKLDERAGIEGVGIEITNDDPIEKKQQIKLWCARNSLSLFCYKAEENRFVPLSYGKLTGDKGFKAMAIGFLSFFGSLLIIHLCYLLQSRVKKRATSNASTVF